MLLVEKVVKLLDDFHFDLFRNYIRDMSNRSFYPLSLIDVIDRNPEVEQNSDKLCKMVYGEVDDRIKKNFFQLAHHTFHMSAYLAQNYPNYLQHNFTKIQHFINQGQFAEGIQLAEMLRDVSEKVEDFDTEIKISTILAQKEVLLESAKQAQKYYDRIEVLLEYKKNVNQIFKLLHTHFDVKGKLTVDNSVEEYLEDFLVYEKSESHTIRLLSQYCLKFALYKMRDEQFYTKMTYDELVELESELDKYRYLVTPYLFTLGHRIAYIKLLFMLRARDKEEIFNEANAIIERTQHTLFWKSFVNLPELFSISVQTSFYVNEFMHSYRDDHMDLVPPETRDNIRRLQELCEELLENELLETKFTLRYISVMVLYSGLLILGDKNDIKKAIKVLDKLLIFYQQVPFHSTIDQIYVNLMMAAFCLHDFDKLNESYKRYKKATKGKVVNPENDLTIHGFYFAGKWLETQRNQYLKKLKEVIGQLQTPRLESTKKILLGVVDYYEIPL